MPAIVRASYYGASASEPAGSTAETGIVMSRSDAKAPAASTAPVPRPTATGTAFSWPMLLAIEVTTSFASNINNRTISASAAYATGIKLFWGMIATYRRPVSGFMPPDSGSNGATPAPTGAGAPGSYVAVTTTSAVYDSGTDSAGATGRSGDFVELVLAVDFTFAGGGGLASLGNVLLSYDES